MSSKKSDDFEYAGSDSSEVVYELESDAPTRSARFSVATLVTTSVLVAVGLVGGAAFALTGVKNIVSANPSVQTDANSTPLASSPSDGSAPATAATGDVRPLPPSHGDKGFANGKTIAVPPAAFEDKDGDRDFHPAPGSGDAATPAPTGTGAPSFGGGRDGGERGGDHGGERHKPRPGGQVPAPNASGAPSFNGGGDHGSNDDNDSEDD